MSTRNIDEKPRRSMTTRVFGGIGIGLLGFVIYWVCDGLFDGFAKYHTYLLTWVVVIALCLFGASVWIVDERRHRDDDE